MKEKQAVKAVKIAWISLLALLLLVGAFWLAGGFGSRAKGEAVVSDNQLTAFAHMTPAMMGLSFAASTTATPVMDQNDLQFSKENGADNTPFDAENMFPGDSLQKRFSIQILHNGPVDLSFEANITEDGGLAPALLIKITAGDGTVIFDGPLSGLQSATHIGTIGQSASGKSVATYDVQLYLPTKTGNEYENTYCKGDLIWTVSGDLLPVKPPTQTGAVIGFTAVGAVAAAAVVLLALLMKKRRKDDGFAYQNKNRA